MAESMRKREQRSGQPRLARRGAALALAVLCGMGGWAEAAGPQSSVVVLAGAASAAESRRAAAGIAKTAKKLIEAGALVEVRGAGSADAVVLAARMPSKVVESVYGEAAGAGSGAAPEVVLRAADAAAQALSRRSGKRLLVVVTRPQPLSSEAEQMLEGLTLYCQEHAVRVLVLDPAEEDSKTGATPWRKLGEATGGALIDNPKAVMTELAAMSAVAGEPVREKAAAVPVDLPALPAEMPVRVRFLRTSTQRAQSWGTERRHMSAGGPSGGGIVTLEGGVNTEGLSGPMRGLLVVEAPMEKLEFQTDDRAGTYVAKARITQAVRDGGGREVWRAGKEVTIRGSLDKLKRRQSGNLYYVREVTLPGGQYAIEGLVEDLLANKKGGVREPLRTGAGVPGFQVSDAVIVRRFEGAKDRFEADQILSYDGEALSPLLEPVFEADKPVTLEIFLTLYPDLNGGQPELSLELLQQGQVVGRLKLPFTDKLKDTSREGIGAIRGEQKSQFPFLATIRGAKLSGGEYEARVIVRQDRNVVSRSVRFRVEGETAQAKLVVRPAAGAAEAVEDWAGVVLPAIDEAEMKAGGPAVGEEETRQYWEETAQRARDLTDRLPNFRCARETRRLSAPARKPGEWKELDVRVSEVTYEGGRESYRVVSVNGLKADGVAGKREGVKSSGEFGTMLRGIFSPAVAAKYKWGGRALAAGTLCRVFDVDVPKERSNFVLSHNAEQEVAGYRGRIYVDEESGLVKRITIEGEGLPKKFGLQSPSMSLDYGLVKIGDLDYLVPLRSVLQARQGRNVVRNETVFRDYHKFEASSSIVFDPAEKE